MYKILLVEDDSKIREVISDYFKKVVADEFALDMAEDGDTGLDYIEMNEYDIILLDVMLPGMDGFTLCKNVRKRSIAPVIFITARGMEEDILRGYDLGCDDYIVKPFSLATLIAKIRALLYRSKGMVGSPSINIGGISLNPRTMEVFVDKNEINLAPKEYAILKLLMENNNTVMSRDTLITRVWGYDYEGNERVLDNHIKNLRKSLGTCGKLIKTVIGKGYKINE